MWRVLYGLFEIMCHHLEQIIGKLSSIIILYFPYLDWKGIWEREKELFRPVLLLLFSCSLMYDSWRPHGLTCPSSLSFTISWSCLDLCPLSRWWPSNCLIICRSLLFLPSIFPSIKVFSSESALCLRWSKCWSFSFSISPSVVEGGPPPRAWSWALV